MLRPPSTGGFSKLATMQTETQHQPPSSTGAVVTARDVTRVYGAGETAVHALR